MPSYTSVFGGNAVRSADQSLTKITLAANANLVWPEDGGSPATSAIIEVNATVAALSLRLPDARNASIGETITFRNTGANSFSVLNNASGAIVTIAAGLVFTVYLSDNSTAAGTWAFWQAGAGSSTVDAAAIDGPGLEASGGLLRVTSPVAYASIDTTFVANDRGSTKVWTGGSGTFTLPSAVTVGNGWSITIKNAGTGTLTIASTGGQTFDGFSNVRLGPIEASTIYSNGTNFSFTRYAASAQAGVFGFTTLNMNSGGAIGDYVLSAAEYANTGFRLTGNKIGSRTLIIPNAAKDFYIDNQSGGTGSVSIKTATGGAYILRGRELIYCDGTDVYPAQQVPYGTNVNTFNTSNTATTRTATVDMSFGSLVIIEFGVLSHNGAGSPTLMCNGQVISAPAVGAAATISGSVFFNLSNGQVQGWPHAKSRDGSIAATAPCFTPGTAAVLAFTWSGGEQFDAGIIQVKTFANG